MAKVVGGGRVDDTRVDSVMIQHLGGTSVRTLVKPADLGLNSGLEVTVGTQIDLYDDGTYRIANRPDRQEPPLERPVEPPRPLESGDLNAYAASIEDEPETEAERAQDREDHI